MFSDEEIKDLPESSYIQPGDEIISIREVCLSDKFDKKDLGFHGESLLTSSERNDLDVPRSLFRDGFFPDSLEQPQTRFAWTEEDGNIASLVSEPGFGTTGQTTFGKEFDAVLKCEMKEADTSSEVLLPTSRNGMTFARKTHVEPHLVTSTSSGAAKGVTCKVDKADPRSRFHYVKYVKRHGRTIKLWECGICGREFQHQYTLMRHLPTHTDERNFHCDACGKSFRQLSTLSQHRAIHSAERPYACEVCKKTFNRVSTLISHRKTHSDEKPYKCHICPKGFHQKGNLRNHLFTHTNERPYRCNICLKGFNQQSNLVCHKNKAHPDDNCSATGIVRSRSTPRITRPAPEPQPDSTRPPQVEHCEVSSSVEPYIPTMQVTPPTAWTKPPSWEMPKPYSEQTDIWGNEGQLGSGVIVDPIRTYHMQVALDKKQTPFALLKPDNGTPVLVKVVDTALPGGKQMLVPATAEDLRDGGKIVVKNEDSPEHPDVELTPAMGGAVQIKVPVVATVVPRIRPGGRLQLIVEEPHYAYHTTLTSDVVNMEPCTSSDSKSVSLPPMPPVVPRPEIRRSETCSNYDDDPIRPTARISSTCTLPPPAPSPPLDLISMDLFEPMECIPMGPQIIAVDNIDQPPPSDDSDIFIGEFERPADQVTQYQYKLSYTTTAEFTYKESIALSDSD